VNDLLKKLLILGGREELPTIYKRGPKCRSKQSCRPKNLIYENLSQNKANLSRFENKIK
jgi:hypothetical protein